MLPVTGETRFIFICTDWVFAVLFNSTAIREFTSLILVVNSGILELAELEGNQVCSS